MDVAQLDHAIIVQFSGVALRVALHIINIDFELN